MDVVYHAFHIREFIIGLKCRIRPAPYTLPRIIDIDILLFNEETIATTDLTIPHAEMQNRRFALQPLADIAPGAVHPVLHKTIRQLLEECPDRLEVSTFLNDE